MCYQNLPAFSDISMCTQTQPAHFQLELLAILHQFLVTLQAEWQIKEGGEDVEDYWGRFVESSKQNRSLFSDGQMTVG